MKAVFLFLAALGLVWLSVLAPFQGPDEVVHFGRIEVMENAWMNAFSDYEGAQAECRTETTNLINKHRVRSVRHNPLSSYAAPVDSGRRGGTDLHEDGCAGDYTFNQIGYYLTALPFVLATPSKGLFSFYMMRLVSWGAMMALLYIAFQIGTLLFGKNKYALMLPLLIGLNPVFMAVGISVNYDSLTNLWFALAFWVSFSFLIKKGPFKEKKKFLKWGLGITIAAVLTKTVGVMVPVFLMITALLSKQFKWQHSLGLVAGVGALGAWFTHNNWQHVLDISATLQSLSPNLFLDRWKVVFESFWGGWGFGWLDVYGPPLFLLGCAVFLIGGLAGALKKSKKAPNKKVVVYSLLCLIVFELAALIYSLPFLKPNFAEAGFSQGRYYFPVMIPLYFLLVEGWRSWATKKKYSKLIPLVIVSFFLIYHAIYLEAIVIPRFYF
jgi:hypothetical protein